MEVSHDSGFLTLLHSGARVPDDDGPHPPGRLASSLPEEGERENAWRSRDRIAEEGTGCNHENSTKVIDPNTPISHIPGRAADPKNGTKPALPGQAGQPEEALLRAGQHATALAEEGHVQRTLYHRIGRGRSDHTLASRADLAQSIALDPLFADRGACPEIEWQAGHL
jgi:hypothetical protein